MATDRSILKTQQVGALTTAPDIVAPKTAVANAHTRSRDFPKVGTENAETNVASTVMFTVNRASKTASVQYLTGTTTASDNTDYVVITVKKQTAGAAATTIATYNTHGGAQGAITGNVPASFSVVANSDSTLAANDTLHYIVSKIAAGKVLAIGTLTFDGEEI
jgi:hypothetical protein